MKISFLTPPDDLSGGLRVVAIYAANLQARGHQVQLISQPAPVPGWRACWRAWRHGGWQAVQQLRTARFAPGHLAAAGVPRHVLATHRPILVADVPDADVVIATWWETAAWMHALPASKGRKVHLIQGYEVWWGDEVAHRRVQAALCLPNTKVAVSAGLKSEIEQDLGALGIQVVNNAVDTDQFNAAVRHRAKVPTVGFVYSPDPIKGADRCASVIAHVRRQLPALRVLAFGSQLPTADCPLPPGTEYHHCPAQAALASLYARCDVWLFASRVDSFGLPILEAMACRTPVVGLPVGAAADLLDGEAGLLVKPRDEASLPESMAAATCRLLTMPPPAWRDMSDRAYARARAYTWDDAVTRLEGVLYPLAALAGLAQSGETP